MPSLAETRFETQRLLLRPFRHADAAQLFAFYSDPQVYRYVPVGGWKHVDEAHQRIARAANTMAAGDEVRLAMERRDNGSVIGELLLFNLNRDSRRADIGYALAREAWGQGFMSEALPPLIEFAFSTLEMRRLEAEIDPRNTASAKVLERMGFRHEGFLRERWLLRGEISDSGLYGLLSADWQARKSA